MPAFLQPRLLRIPVARARSPGLHALSSGAACSACANPAPLLDTVRHSRALTRAVLRDAISRCSARVAVDATCGRGSDTLTLCALLGAGGLVHAVDVQRAAVAETEARYWVAATAAAAAGAPLAALSAHCADHADLGFLGVRAGGAAAAVYNLGWYPAPGADRALVTRPASTAASLRGAVRLLAPCGVLVVTAYPGHPGGREEADAVRKFVEQLSPRAWSCTLLQYPNRDVAPLMHVCERIK